MAELTLLDSLQEQFPVYADIRANQHIERLRVVPKHFLLEDEARAVVAQAQVDEWWVEHTYWSVQQGQLQITELGFVKARRHVDD